MTPQEKRNATYQRNRQRREERERQRREQLEAEKAALRYIIDTTDAEPGEVLEAVRLLNELENHR